MKYDQAKFSALQSYQAFSSHTSGIFDIMTSLFDGKARLVIPNDGTSSYTQKRTWDFEYKGNRFVISEEETCFRKHETKSKYLEIWR
tara:strand:- start:23 stop:283 length:261 start_codon:yes stop_codon:yes gene_type:complete